MNKIKKILSVIGMGLAGFSVISTTSLAITSCENGNSSEELKIVYASDDGTYLILIANQSCY
jgi:hypothetical protein